MSLDLYGKKKSSTGKMKASDSNISQSSIFDLKSILSETKDKFAMEGKGAVKGEIKSGRKVTSDKFSKPSPGIVKRMAMETKNELRHKKFEQESVESEERRNEIMRIKAEKYNALKRGDFGALTDRELAECTVDFEKKWKENDFESDSPSNSEDEDQEEEEDDSQTKIEYVDELGRTRTGTKSEAREAETARRRGEGTSGTSANAMPLGRPRTGRGGEGGDGQGGGEGAWGEEIGEAHKEVMESNVIHGAQSFFPVYEQTQEEIRRRERDKLRAKVNLVPHYDSTTETRARAAGAYQFAQDEDARMAQQDALKAERAKTQAARAKLEEDRRLGLVVDDSEDDFIKLEDGSVIPKPEVPKPKELSAAQIAKKRKLDERRELIEAKRLKLLGGKAGVEKRRQEIQDREAEKFLEGIRTEFGDEDVKPLIPEH